MQIAAGIGGTYAFIKLCMKKYAEHEVAETVVEEVERATSDAIRTARAELASRPGFQFTQDEIDQAMGGLERALRIDYAQRRLACSDMGGELYNYMDDGESKEACMCNLESARRASAAGSTANACERLIENTMGRHSRLQQGEQQTQGLIDQSTIRESLPQPSSTALVVPRNDVVASRSNLDQLRLGHPDLYNNLQLAVRQAANSGDQTIRLPEELSRQLIAVQNQMDSTRNAPQNWEDWSIEIAMDPESFSEYDPQTIIQMYNNLEEAMYSIQGIINNVVIREMQLRASNVGTVVSGGNTFGWFERINPFSSHRVRRLAMQEARNAYNREIQAVRDIARNRMDGLQLIRANLRRVWQRILSISNIAAAQISEYDSIYNLVLVLPLLPILNLDYRKFIG